MSAVGAQTFVLVDKKRRHKDQTDYYTFAETLEFVQTVDGGVTSAVNLWMQMLEASRNATEPPGASRTLFGNSSRRLSGARTLLWDHSNSVLSVPGTLKKPYFLSADQYKSLFLSPDH